MNTLKIQIPEGFKVESFDEKSGIVKLAALPKDIKERVKTVTHAIEILGYDDVDVKDYFAMVCAGLQDHIIGNQELIIITKALNEDWTPDWHNGNWDKWFNWFNMSSSSSGRFSFSAPIISSRFRIAALAFASNRKN